MSVPARSFQVTFRQILMFHLFYNFLCCTFFTGPHSKFFIGVNNEETTDTSSTIKPLIIIGKGPATLNNESVEQTFTTDSVGALSGLESLENTPPTTSSENSTTVSDSSSTTSTSVGKSNSTGDQGTEDEETTTMMVAGEVDVTTSKINEDYQMTSKINKDYQMELKTRIKSGGAVIEFQINERDLNEEKGRLI